MAEIQSQNGYIAGRLDLTKVYTIPGTKVKMRLREGDVAEVLLYLAERFDNEVEDIDTVGSYPADPAPNIAGSRPSGEDDDWSWAVRNVRDSTTVVSNHASGTAMDLNATQHPRGVHNTFTAEQIRRVRRILADLVDTVTGRCVVRWGEDFKTVVDGMHFEIWASLAEIARVAARIRAWRKEQQEPKSEEEHVMANMPDDEMKKLASFIAGAIAAIPAGNMPLATQEKRQAEDGIRLSYRLAVLGRMVAAALASDSDGVKDAAQLMEDSIFVGEGSAINLKPLKE